MARVTRWFIKTGLLYLVGALAAGAVPGLAAAASPGYVHALTLGWLSQLIFGVAFWLFPAPPGARPPYDERPLWAVYCLLNAGLIGRLIAEPRAATGGPWGLLLAASALALLVASTLFAAVIWPRCRSLK